jgi:hypothetical protein
MPTPPPRYVYQRRGGPLLSWVNGPPRTQVPMSSSSLGALGGTDVFAQPVVLPRPGAPEYISMGCACDEAREQDRNEGEYIVMARGPIRRHKRDTIDTVIDIATLGALGASVYFVFKALKKSA